MKNLITAVLLLLPVAGRAQSRAQATCDVKVAMETRSVCQSSVELLPIPATTNGAIGANNSSGTWISEHREVWAFNNDASASNVVFLSTFPLANTTSDTGKAWPIPGGNTNLSAVFLRVGSSIRLWVTRAIGCGTVTAFVCK